VTFYERPAEFIDYEPVASVDPYLRGMMASIGIVKGQPFTPNDSKRAIFNRAAQVAPKMAEARNLSTTKIPQRLY
jgi:hypothetical protein